MQAEDPQHDSLGHCVRCSFKDKEVQRDAKMVSYKVVDKETKPYIEVEISGEKKVHCGACLSPLCAAYLRCEDLLWSRGGGHAPPDPAKPGMTGPHMKEGMYCKRWQPSV